MSPLNENLLKAAIVLGGGYLLFMAVKPKLNGQVAAASGSPIKSFDSGNANKPKPSMENAEIVANAYVAAMQAGEPASKLTELNQECMKDFGMRAYVDKNDKLIVCDASGEIIISK